MKHRHHNQEAVGYSKVYSRFSGIKQVAWLLLPVAALAILTYAIYSQQGGENQPAQTSLLGQSSPAETQGAGGPESDICRNGKAVPHRQSIPGSPVPNIAEEPDGSVNVPPTDGPAQGLPLSTLSGWANTSTLAAWQVADLINKMVMETNSYGRSQMLSALDNAPRGPGRKASGFGQRFSDAHGQHECGTACPHSPHGQGVHFYDGLELVPLPPQMTANETLPAGTLIIAMDNALQDNSTTRVRRAYGLAVHLLHADIPLKWIINPNKTSRTAVDFSASARRRYPSTSGYSSRSFRTGPLAIFPGYEAEAQSVINSYGNGIRVYELQSATTVPVHSDLTHKPKVLVEEDENPDIHIDVLSAAGLQGGTHYNEGPLVSVNANSCVTIITVPHNSSISSNQRNKVKDFVRSGGNFLAQCAAVRSFQANNPRAFTNAGFRDEPGLGNFAYDNPTEPSAQFEGNIADEGGSLEDFGFNTQPPGGTRIVHGTGGQANNYKAYTGPIDGFTADAGGYVHYLGGHNHDGNINADRFYLNAVLRSADRPMGCGLTIELVNANDDTGTIDCANGSVTINVLANDDNPQGNPLTVNLLGNGSNGTFVNNNDGTVTYTGNVGGFWGGDQVSYEACDGTTCDQATITVTAPNPNENLISGTVFEDSNTNGSLNAGESGPAGTEVDLYVDENNDNQVDGGDTFLETTTTDANGDYQFTVTPPITCTSSNTTITTDKGDFGYQDKPGYNHGSCDGLAIDSYTDYQSRSFIEFNLGGIDPGCTVASAQLVLTHYDWSFWGEDGSVNISARRITQPWTEGSQCYDPGSGLTWNNQPNYTGSYGVVAASASDNDGEEYTFNVTSLVQGWINGTFPNYGIALVPNSLTGNGYLAIYADGTSNAPRLEITFNSTGGGANTYVMEVDAATLPTGGTFTTDNLETADFSGSGQLDCNNNFGFKLCPTPPDAGTDGTTTICEGVSPAVIDLFDIITGEDTGGTWSETTAGANSGVSIGSGTSVDFSSTPLGTYEFTYTVTATDCPPDTATATITVPAAVAVALDSKTDASCNSAADGAISITASGGTPGYTYLWSDGATAEDRTGLAAGTYTVTVTDANGCIGTLTAVITESSDIVLTGTQMNLACFGGNNGSIQVTASGGTAPYNVSWSGASSGNPPGDEIAASGGSYNITGLIAGAYTVTVTDAVGCTATLSRTLTQPAALTAVPTATNYLCFGQTGSISLAVNGGTTPRTFSWAGPGGFTATTQNISGLAEGTYTVTVMDANNCTTTAMATVTGPASAVAVALDSKTGVSCDGSTDGTINITASGGTPGYTYGWSDGATAEDRSGLAPGTYTVTVTDANGCTGTLTETIAEPGSLFLTISKMNPTCPPGVDPPLNSDGTIDLTVSGGTAPYTYAWTTNDGAGLDPSAEDQTGLTAGTYAVTVTDANGCTATVSVTLENENQTPVTPVGINNN